MKLIEGEEKEIILEDEDVIIISSLKKNKVKLKITCQNGALQIDDLPYKEIKNLAEENKAIQAIKNYIDKK